MVKIIKFAEIIISLIILGLAAYAILTLGNNYLRNVEQQGEVIAENGIGQTVKLKGNVELDLFDQKTGQKNGIIILVEKTTTQQIIK